MKNPHPVRQIKSDLLVRPVHMEFITPHQELPLRDWREQFEQKILHIEPRHAGCINWREADHHYHYGSTPAYAAACYLVAHETRFNPEFDEPD